jgi:hypothetical protein
MPDIPPHHLEMILKYIYYDERVDLTQLQSLHEVVKLLTIVERFNIESLNLYVGKYLDERKDELLQQNETI